MSNAIYTHKKCLAHETGEGHPESPDRLRRILSLLDAPPYDQWPVHEAAKAKPEWLRLVHDAQYIETMSQIMPAQGLLPLEADTIVSPASYEAALYAAGAGCGAADDIAAGKIRRAFCAVRPPGHHAETARPMGFCLFGNAAITARYAQDYAGFARIAIIDFDVHHGNGTQITAEKCENIFYISSHQTPLFPNSGQREENIEGRILNMPLTDHDGPDGFHALYENEAFPAIKRFRPDLIVISAGFDAHKDDPLAGLNLEAEDYYRITKEICDIADAHCSGRVISLLEGGYNLDALGPCVAAHLRGFDVGLRA
jgi:acetoin utilization deacetylase AcuC-like enzyme